MNKILGLATEGKPIRAIARELQHSRNTVRKYLRGAPSPAARPRRRSKLDPYKEQIMAWLSTSRPKEAPCVGVTLKLLNSDLRSIAMILVASDTVERV